VTGPPRRPPPEQSPPARRPPPEQSRPASPARRLALIVLREADKDGAYVNLALDRALEGSRLSPVDRSLATELVYGTTRWRGRLDYVLDRLSSRPVDDLPVSIRNILRLGLYQLLYLTRVPRHAAVAESVALGREFGHRGTAGLVNAVLRRAADEAADVPLPPADGDPAERLAVEYSHPAWIVRRWLARFGPEATAALCRVDNEAAPLTLRANLTRTSRDTLIKGLAREGVRAEVGRLCPEAVICREVRPLRDLLAFRKGLFSVQDEGAMAASRAVAPEPGWLVVDACAGVGGKTTHLAELMGGRGRVVAVDPYGHKLRLLRESAARLRLGGIETRQLDSRRLPESDLAGVADAVLVDVPCSGLGVLRRRPDLRWRLRESDLPGLVALQRELLAAAGACLRPGGVLVYATCTLEPEENEGIIEGFLASNLEFDAVGLGQPASPLLPTSGGPDGFFVARMQRRVRSKPAGMRGN